MRGFPLLVLLLASPAVAQVGPPLTLETAIDIARRTSPLAEAANAAVRAADAGRRVAELRPNPTLGLEIENVGGSRAYDVVETPKQTASVSYPLEFGGKRSARIDLADAQGSRAAIDRAVADADLCLGVTQAYLEALAADRRLDNAREQARIGAEGLRAARLRVQAGRASPLEQSRAAVVRANADLAVERQSRLVITARQVLALRIGQPASGPLDKGWFDRVAGVPSSRSDTLAVATSRADIATAVAQERLASSQRLPDVTVSAGVRRVPVVGSTAAVLGFSVPLPLFNSGSAAVEQARAERARAEALAHAVQLGADEAVSKVEAERDNAASTARAAMGPTLATAQEAARIARIGYGEGKFGQLDLLEAERALAETRLAAIDALAAYHDAQARLERLTIPYTGVTK